MKIGFYAETQYSLLMLVSN